MCNQQGLLHTMELLDDVDEVLQRMGSDSYPSLMLQQMKSQRNIS